MSERFSQFDVDRINSRNSKKQSDCPNPPCDPVEKESDLHSAISSYCRSKGWLCWHGSMVHKAMRTVGEPDFTILADRGRVFFVECKSKTGKIRPEQQGMIEMAAMNGHSIKICRSMNDFFIIVQ